jgi:hypothetical protein
MQVRKFLSARDLFKKNSFYFFLYVATYKYVKRELVLAIQKTPLAFAVICHFVCTFLSTNHQIF